MNKKIISAISAGKMGYINILFIAFAQLVILFSLILSKSTNAPKVLALLIHVPFFFYISKFYRGRLGAYTLHILLGFLLGFFFISFASWPLSNDLKIAVAFGYIWVHLINLFILGGGIIINILSKYLYDAPLEKYLPPTPDSANTDSSNQENVIQAIRVNPGLPYEEVKRQALAIGLTEALFEEAWTEAHTSEQSQKNGFHKFDCFIVLIVSLLPLFFPWVAIPFSIIIPIFGGYLWAIFPFLLIARFYSNRFRAYFLSIGAGLLLSIPIALAASPVLGDTYGYLIVIVLSNCVTVGISAIVGYFISKKYLTPLNPADVKIGGDQRQKRLFGLILIAIVFGIWFLMSLADGNNMDNWIMIILSVWMTCILLLTPIYFLLKKIFKRNDVQK